MRAAAVLAAYAAGPAHAAESRIPKLIAESQGLPGISAQIDAISRALLGARYRGYTLIGGPKQPETMVTRDDGFDCVTYCETVLAAANARAPDQFEPLLRAIRYRDGVVNWFARNHYHYEWSARNIEAGFVRAVELPDSVTLGKTVYQERALGRRDVTMRVSPQHSLFAHAASLQTGDIVGFVSRRAYYDFFHTGFVAFGPRHELLVRHASQHHRRVVDEPMQRFIRVNRTQYVTLLRPVNPGA